MLGVGGGDATGAGSGTAVGGVSGGSGPGGGGEGADGGGVLAAASALGGWSAGGPVGVSLGGIGGEAAEEEGGGKEAKRARLEAGREWRRQKAALTFKPSAAGMLDVDLPLRWTNKTAEMKRYLGEVDKWYQAEIPEPRRMPKANRLESDNDWIATLVRACGDCGVDEAALRELYDAVLASCSHNERATVLVTETLKRRAMWDIKRRYYSRIGMSNKIMCEPGYMERPAALSRKKNKPNLMTVGRTFSLADARAAYKSDLSTEDWRALKAIIRSRSNTTADSSDEEAV